MLSRHWARINVTSSLSVYPEWGLVWRVLNVSIPLGIVYWYRTGMVWYAPYRQIQYGMAYLAMR